MEQKWLRQEQMGKMEWKSQHTEKVLKSWQDIRKLCSKINMNIGSMIFAMAGFTWLGIEFEKTSSARSTTHEDTSWTRLHLAGWNSQFCSESKTEPKWQRHRTTFLVRASAWLNTCSCPSACLPVSLSLPISLLSKRPSLYCLIHFGCTSGAALG